MEKELARELETLLRERGASIVGFADLSLVPAGVRNGLPFAVSFGVAMTPSIVAGIADGPTEEYGREYDRLNDELGKIADAGADLLKKRGWRAEARRATMSQLPSDLITPLPQKTVATLAGLGWIGKCALLITPDFGPALRLNSILTDAPVPAGVPVLESKCAGCTVCVDICPGKAPSGREWKRGMERAVFFDAFACQDACVRVGKERGLSHLICGKCLGRCPFTLRWLAKAA